MMLPYEFSEHNGSVTVTVGGKASMAFPDVTALQMVEGKAAYDAGKLIQDAFPFLNADQREFLLTGLTPEAWNELFGDEEDC